MRGTTRIRVDYTPRVRVDSVEASCRLARLGVGLAAPPTYLSDEPIRRGELRAVLPEWRLEPLKVYAVWPPNVPASSIAYTLINRLYEAFNPGQRRAAGRACSQRSAPGCRPSPD